MPAHLSGAKRQFTVRLLSIFDIERRGPGRASIRYRINTVPALAKPRVYSECSARQQPVATVFRAGPTRRKYDVSVSRPACVYIL